LDPYEACLHQGTERHAALASDLLEGFRAPVVDSLVLYLINRHMIDAVDDFVFLPDGACYLNDSGRRKYLQAFIQRMEEEVEVKPGVKSIRWDTLNHQVKIFRDCVVNSHHDYQSYQIR
jgi:CRISP-associated protein Cas1